MNKNVGEDTTRRKELMDELHGEYDAYVFFGIPPQKGQTDEDPLQRFQTCFKAPTISEALGMMEFFKHSLLQGQMEEAEKETLVRKVEEKAPTAPRVTSVEEG